MASKTKGAIEVKCFPLRELTILAQIQETQLYRQSIRIVNGSKDSS